MLTSIAHILKFLFVKASQEIPAEEVNSYVILIISWGLKCYFVKPFFVCKLLSFLICTLVVSLATYIVDRSVGVQKGKKLQGIAILVWDEFRPDFISLIPGDSWVI